MSRPLSGNTPRRCQSSKIASHCCWMLPTSATLGPRYLKAETSKTETPILTALSVTPRTAAVDDGCAAAAVAPPVGAAAPPPPAAAGPALVAATAAPDGAAVVGVSSAAPAAGST